MKWTTTDKAEALGISERHVRRLIKDGILPQGGNPKEVTLAYIRHSQESRGGKSDLIEERIRLVRAQANQKEWDLKIDQGEYIHTESAMQLWGRVCQGIRSKLLSFPSKIAPLVFGCNGLCEIKDIAEKQVDEILEEVSNPDLKKYSKMLRADLAHMPNVKTAHKIKRKRMGRSKKSPKSRK